MQRSSALSRPSEAASATHVPQPRLSLAERRRSLIDAARRVFAERGFRGATTRQIAAAAGVTEALIFQHFPHKDALYAAILEERDAEPASERWFAELDEHRAAGDAASVIRTLYTGLIELHERDPDLIRLMAFSALEDHPLARHLHRRATRLYNFLEGFIADGQRRGQFRGGSASVLARATLALPIYYIQQRHLFKMPWPPVKASDVIEEGVQFTLAGLTAGAGRQAARLPPPVSMKVRS
jgi:TetR/AcrR family transcriptional regulator